MDRSNESPSTAALLDDDVMSGRILVIDDEPVVRDVLQAVLDKQGYRVEVASDAATGPVDEHPVARRDLPLVVHRLHRDGPGDRHRAGLLEGDVLGLAHQELGLDCAELGEAAGVLPLHRIVDLAEHSVTDL